MNVVQNLQKIDSVVLANYILKHYGPMSHLKLQKLLFYCDAYHLAYFDQELVEDKFEAWVHGPVCRKVYDELRDKSVLYADIEYSDTGLDEDRIFNSLTEAQQGLIHEILDSLSSWTARELELSTHNEAPWKSARKGFSDADKCHNAISKEQTRSFYKSEIL